MFDEKWERVEDPADPRRCQSGGKEGQCPYKAKDGSIFCARHGANKAEEARNKDALRTYRLNVWEERKNQLADDGKIKSLREEIGIARIMCETLMNSCSNPNELMIKTPQISDLLIKIEKLVVSCNTLEMKMGMLLDRNAILQIASVIVELAAEYVTDPDAREEFAKKICEAIMQTQIKE